MAGDNVVQGGERGRDVFPAQGTACTKSQQDRAQGLWQTLQQASMAGEGGLWEAGGWTRPGLVLEGYSGFRADGDWVTMTGRSRGC